MLECMEAHRAAPNKCRRAAATSIAAQKIEGGGECARLAARRAPVGGACFTRPAYKSTSETRQHAPQNAHQGRGRPLKPHREQ